MLRRLSLVLFACIALAGCGALPRNGVPAELAAAATLPGMPDVRANALQPSAAMEHDFALSFAQEDSNEFPRTADGLVHYAHLALSGGGPNGAFGAGFLNGWTSTGQRPVFKIVTGVSTGALIAPFAFLGSAYDPALREFYTTTASRDIFVFGVFKVLPRLLSGDALADSAPLATLIAQHVDATVLSEIAQAHQRGRRLYIGTANLDAQRFVVWNMGLIASSGRPDALELFRKVLLASASVPVAFPPVLFDVEAGGRRYDEMHVDGALFANVFYSGGLFSPAAVRERAGRGDGRESVFIIHNGQLGAVPEETPRSVPGIARRALSSAGKSAVIGDLYRINALVRREQASFNWITIPDGVEIVGDEIFDPVRMNELYQLGYRMAVEGSKWYTQPPGIRDSEAP